MDEGHLLDDIVGAARDVSVESLHVARIDYFYETLVFVARRVGHHEDHLHVVAGQAARHSVTRRTQTARNMGRKFPAKH